MKYLRMLPLLALLTLTIIPAASAQVVNNPVARTSDGLSLNWSGYAVNVTGVTSVTGTFTVPTVSTPCGVDGFSGDVSVWVGIDGYSSGTVEQTGVSGSCSLTTGAASYYAWWEMYPRSSSTIRTMTVNPGDSITASVVYNGGGSFTLSITDNTNGQSFTTTVHAPANGPNAAQRSSAEWVVERAATIYQGYLTILPLATFASTTFSDATFTLGSGASTTLQSATTAYPPCTGVSPETSCYDQMTMVSVDSSGNITPLVQTSAVSSNSFSVSFLANGAPYLIPGAIGH